MKKIISILLVLVLSLSSLCACGGKGTSLTRENYKDYISLQVNEKYLFQSVDVGHWGSQSRNTDLYFGVYAKGVSTNFNYNNVTIKLRIYGSYGIADLKSISDSPDEYKDFEVFVELNPNISGTTIGGVKSEEIPGNGKAIVTCDYQYEIVSISGTVTPA